MRRLSNMVVRPLAEDLEGMNLDAQAFLGRVAKTTTLVEHRMGENATPIEVPNLPGVVTDLRHDPTHDLPEGYASGGADDEGLEEQFKIVKKQFKTAGMKMKAKLMRKKRGLAKLARQAKMYRRKNRRKIAKRMKKKLAKFGAAGLDRLHKMRKRVVMSAEPHGGQQVVEHRSRIQQLREDLNAVHVEDGSSLQNDDTSNPYEEAAYNAGVLAMYLGEVFEAWGDEESAETMFETSERAAELSEMLEDFDEGDALEESQMDLLMGLLENIEKALYIHEEMGNPTVGAVLEFRLDNDEDFMAECMESDEDPAPFAATEDDDDGIGVGSGVSSDDDDDDPGAGLEETGIEDDDD